MNSPRETGGFLVRCCIPPTHPLDIRVRIVHNMHMPRRRGATRHQAMSDFHHHALAQLDAQQRREDKEQLLNSTITWHIETSVWEQTCFSHDEVKQLQDEAVAEGLSYRVTTCPF